KAASAAGKYSRSWCRSRWTCRVRSQISVLWARATTLTAPASGLSPATARSWWESVRTMSVSMCASPRSLLAPDTPWRSRYLDACSGFTAYTTYPAATSAAAVGLDPDHHLRILSNLAHLLPDQLVQPGHPGHPFRQPLAGQDLARRVHQLHVVMVLGPVVADEQSHMFSRPRSRIWAS